MFSTYYSGYCSAGFVCSVKKNDGDACTQSTECNSGTVYQHSLIVVAYVVAHSFVFGDDDHDAGSRGALYGLDIHI